MKTEYIILALVALAGFIYWNSTKQKKGISISIPASQHISQPISNAPAKSSGQLQPPNPGTGLPAPTFPVKILSPKFNLEV